MDDDENLEYPIPAPSLTKRDPIFFNKLSFREVGQWAVILLLMYGAFNVPLPLAIPFRIIIAGLLFMLGLLFIHSPINGLSGIEHFYIGSLFISEKKAHKTVAPVNIELKLGRKPTFDIFIKSSLLTTNANGSKEHVGAVKQVAPKETATDEQT